MTITEEPSISSSFDLEAALESLKGFERCLLLTHTNPDPDGIAAAYGLRYLLEERTSMRVTLGYSGIIGRAENRAMVRLLEIPLHPIAILDFNEFDCIALVDTQPTAGNNVVPVSRAVNIVIDHHVPRRNWKPPSVWDDVRAEAAASCFIVYEYLLKANLPLSPKLATAMLYGLLTDTMDMGRCTGCSAALNAYVRLLTTADLPLLAKIRQPDLPRDYYRILNQALRHTKVWGKRLITLSLDDMPYPDLTAELADFLIRSEGIEVSLCVGSFKDQLHLSMRTSNTDGAGFKKGSAETASHLIMPLVEGRGSAGGHNEVAGGAIALNGQDAMELGESLAKELAKALSCEGPSRPLIPPK